MKIWCTPCKRIREMRAAEIMAVAHLNKLIQCHACYPAEAQVELDRMLQIRDKRLMEFAGHESQITNHESRR